MDPIEIVFQGKDETKAAVASVKDGLDSIQQSSTETSSAVSGIFTIEGTQAMFAFKDAAVDAFKTAGAAAMEFVDAAAEAELVNVRMEATMKALGDRAPTTSKQINELADELSKLTGFDDEALIEAQATLARMGSVSEENFERATRAAVDLSAATGMDLKSAFQAVGMAMENADFGRLARQIGDLPPEMQAAAKAALEMGDTLKVQEIILSGIEQKVDGAGEAIGETFTGQMNKLRTEYGNFQESVGTPMLSLFTGLPDVVKTAGFGIYSLGQTFGPVISSVADLAIATRGLNAAMGGQGLIGLLGQVKLLGATSFLPMIASLGAVALAVGAVIIVWDQWNKQIVKTNEEGKKAVESTWTTFFKDLEASGKSGEEILSEYRAAQERTNQVLEDANPIVRAFVFNKKDLVQADEELRASLLRTTGSQEEVNRLMAESSKATEQSSQAAKEAATSGWAEWADSVGRFGDEIERVIGSELPLAFEDGSGKLQEFFMLFGVGEDAAQEFGQKIYDIFRTDLPIAFEDGSGKFQVFLQTLGIGEEAAQRIGQHFYDMAASIKTAFASLSAIPAILSGILTNIQIIIATGFQIVLTTINQTLSNVSNSIKTTWQNIANTIRQWLDRIVSYIRNFGANMRTAFQNVINDAKNWGLGIVNGLWQGILDGWAGLRAKIEALAQSLPQWIKEALNIASPSKVMAKEVGEPIAQGIGLGFVEGMKKIKPMFDLQPASIGFTPAPAYARAGSVSGVMGGGASISGNTFQFYSPLTHDERRRIRKEQEETAQREMLRSLR